MVTVKRVFFLLLMLLFHSTILVFAEGVPVVEFDSESTKLDLTPYIQILPDPDQSLRLSDVTGEKQKDFQSVSEISNSFGFSKSAYWVFFSLHMSPDLQDSPLLQLQYPLIDNITLFIPDGSGGYTQNVTGDALRFVKRDVKHRTYLFSLPRHKGETRDYYMRLQTEGSTLIPLAIWKAETFIEEMDGSNILLGAYYGVLLLLLLAAFVSYLKIGDNVFLFYGLYLLSYFLLQFSLDGLSYQYLWPNLSWFTSRATAAFIGLVVVCATLFTGSFLQVWSNRHPRVKNLFYVLIAWGAVGALLSLFGNYAFAVKFSAASGLFLPPVVLIAIVSSLAIGYKPARYFLVGWCVFLLGVFVEGLLYLGLIPHNIFNVNAMQIGSAFVVILLGYALMDRIELLRIEKEKAVVQANEYLLQLNEKLELLVDKRTKTLQLKNKKLREIAVQDSMTGLLNHKASLDFLRLRKSSAQRYGKNLAVIMLDIDRFKVINDRFGHPAGDKVIIAITATLKGTLRESDGCGRYGGEEFLLILPESGVQDVCFLAERIRLKIEELRIPEIDNLPVTASLGIAVFDPSNPDENLIGIADKALYEAKHSGRNQVVIADDGLKGGVT